MREPSPRPYSVFPGIGRTPKLVSACHGAMRLPLARPGSVTTRRLEARREELEEGEHMLRGTLPGSQTTAKNPAHDPLPSFPAPASRNLPAQRITCSADGTAHLRPRCCFALPSRPLRLHRSRDPFISAALHNAQPAATRLCPALPCPALPGSSLLPPFSPPSLPPPCSRAPPPRQEGPTPETHSA